MSDDSPGRQEKYKGPVVMRRSQVDGTTTDQRLLDSRGPSDWVHTDPWRVETVRTEETRPARPVSRPIGDGLLRTCWLPLLLRWVPSG